MATILQGEPVVKAMGEQLRGRIDELGRRGIKPTLATVRLGARPDDVTYENAALKQALHLGMGMRPYVLDAQTPQAALEATLQSINYDTSLHGCLLFRPLPDHIDESAMCDAIQAVKDVDGVSLVSLSSVFTDSNLGFPPSTAEACIKVLDHYGVAIEGKHVVVIGRSLVVGKPLAMMLLARNASATVCHSRTENLARLSRMADVVVCATGQPRRFGAEFFRPGQVVLDVGIDFDERGYLCGDVDYPKVAPIVDALTPVPGGIGTVTTSVTMEHTVEAAFALNRG